MMILVLLIGVIGVGAVTVAARRRRRAEHRATLRRERAIRVAQEWEAMLDRQRKG